MKITSKHMAMLKDPEDGLYPAKITEIKQELNKKKTGENIVVTLTLQGGECDGREFKTYYAMNADFGIAKFGGLVIAAGGEIDENKDITAYYDELQGVDVCVEIIASTGPGQAKARANVEDILPISAAPDRNSPM